MAEKKKIKKNKEESENKEIEAKKIENLETTEKSEKKPEIESAKKEDIKLDEKDGEIKDLKKSQNKQIIWLLAIMGGIIILFLIFFYTWDPDRHFEYYKLDFYKTQLGERFFYSTKIPVVNEEGKIYGDYKINFRNNPRNLEDIPVNVPLGIITFKPNNTIYLTVDSNISSCPETDLGLIELSSFLSGFRLKTVKAGYNDKEFAEDLGAEYYSCENNRNNTVIYLKSGNETKITQTASNCFVLEFRDCEDVQVMEKFKLKIIDHHMSFFTKE